MNRDLATRRMRVGYEHTLENAIWGAAVIIAIVGGFLAGYLVRGRLMPPTIVNPPAIVTAPTAYCACPISSATSCLEVARMCVAQKRSMAVRP